MTLRMMTLLALLCLTGSFSHAAEKAGEIRKYEGNVKIYSEGSLQGETVTSDDRALFVKEIVKTRRGATAHIAFIDGSEALLKERSILEIEELRGFGIGEGRVIFHIKKQHELEGIAIKSRSIVIGVKGTTFAVDLHDDAFKVYLKEGKLNIRSLKEEFVRYRKAEKEAYDQFRKEAIDEFGKYKKGMEREFKEFVKEFDMTAGTAISVEGNEVRDLAIPDDIEREFLFFENR